MKSPTPQEEKPVIDMNEYMKTRIPTSKFKVGKFKRGQLGKGQEK